MKNEKQIVPEIGMGATIVMWSDRHAGTIVKITESLKTIWIQKDKATRIDDNGASDNQAYSYGKDIEGIVLKATLRKNGTYKTIGESGNQIALDSRSEFFDYAF